MGGCRCSYKNCPNSTNTRENLHFFHYPIKQKERCRQWIENANKPKFYDLDEVQLRNKVVCETHFEEAYFPNPQKKRLLQGAIPTLDGDCKVEYQQQTFDQMAKLHDVQVLPANDDGTIFVLETNHAQPGYHSKIESYIYTHNGLVLPIGKAQRNENIYITGDIEMDSSIPENQNENKYFIGSENLDAKLEGASYVFQNEEPVTHITTVPHINTVPHANTVGVSRNNNEVEADDEEIIEDRHLLETGEKQEIINESEKSEEVNVRYQELGSKYVKKIRQHSKDIAQLKRMLKARTIMKKPSTNSILTTLKRQLPASLLSVLNINLRGNCVLSLEDAEFFSTVYRTSPELYVILAQKYKWRLPNPEILENVVMDSPGPSNGHDPYGNEAELE